MYRKYLRGHFSHFAGASYVSLAARTGHFYHSLFLQFRPFDRQRNMSQVDEESLRREEISDVDDCSNAADETNPKKIRLTKAEKRELKKERNKEKFNELKKRKRELKKEQQKEKREKLESLREQLPPRKMPTEGLEVIDRKLRKQQEQQSFLDACESNFEVILDCSWEHEHNESSLKSLIQQIMFCYGANRKSKTPSSIRLFGMGAETKERLSKVNCSNWLGFYTYEDDFIAHMDWFSREPVNSVILNEAAEFQPAATEGDSSTSSAMKVPFRKRQLVYLTSDAEETLETLDSNCTYIIGGIVDRNRLKGITHKKALAHNIRAAKLPIKDLFAMSSTHVLTVNHVFDIMLKFQESNSWKEAMNSVLPRRKDAKPVNTTDEQDDANEIAGENEEGASNAKRPRVENDTSI